ncbi:Malonyl CoA-acyl carrier protein transacylase [Hondaea fermentalgiana]|uniref:Malonyl CoA-acyl carrier protein transacylase n=1 Tax=Hondaea fermentalgiana TaxID=2315210 RepID=A0A2R5FYJ7_9STRA|nr:Malonyl CoA-acyl carrier protein transacylase [Hondaea fermentalgiana]|eukprot:GBG23800.1 Malonyl CoA-acyl carrier protein transacylase [Hondaea fermentalgiana]
MAVPSDSSEATTARVIFVLVPGQGTRSEGVAPLQSARVASCAQDELGLDVTRLTAEQLSGNTYYAQLAVGVRALDRIDRLRKERSDLFAQPGTQTCFAGFSVGEIPALVGAGKLSLRDGLRVLRARAAAMQSACEAVPGTMVTLQGVQDETALLAHGSIASKLYPGCCVVAGPSAKLTKVNWVPELAERARVRTDLAGAFHTEQMTPGADAIRNLRGKVMPARGRPDSVIFANVSGKLYTDTDDVLECLADQVVSTVQWESILQSIVADPRPKVIVDLASKGQFRAMLRSIDPSLVEDESLFVEFQ